MARHESDKSARWAKIGDALLLVADAHGNLKVAKARDVLTEVDLRTLELEQEWRDFMARASQV